jgi:hypothetical protein
MTANINPTTGIAYGYIAAHALDGETVDQLMHGPQATDETRASALDEWLAEWRIAQGDNAAVPDSWEEQKFWDGFECDEPAISGTLDGVTYRTSWLGGALNFFILHSPVTTDKANLASPCVPNAGIIDTLDGSITSYDVPADWRHQENKA